MSFRLKTILGIAFIEALMLGMLIFTITSIIEQTKSDELIHQATNTAHLFATTTKDSVLTSDLAALDSFILEVMKNEQLLYARVISSTGLVLAEKHRSKETKIKPFQQDQTLNDVTDNSFDTSATIAEAGFEYGRVELGFSISAVARVVNDAQEKAIVIALFELFLSALFSCFLGYYLTRQLRTLKDAAHAIESGNFNITLKNQGNDEIGMTITAFNRMSAKLDQTWKERNKANTQLKDLNNALEKKVFQRTQQLEKTQKDALTVAHRAGMADIASGAIHNIGNVINSAKTDLTLAQKSLNSLSINKFEKINNFFIETTGQSENNNSTKNDTLQDIAEYYQSLHTTLFEQTKEIKNYMSTLKNHIEKTALIIADQQTTAKQTSIVLNDCCLDQLLEQITTPLESTLHRNGISIQIESIGLRQRVKLHVNKLHQILLNLCMNAIDATKAGKRTENGIIDKTISIRLDYTGLSETTSNKKMVSICITDSGDGVPSHLTEKIFQSGYTTKPQGNGFGLHSCATLAVEMKGSLQLLPQSNQAGATFELILPTEPCSNSFDEINSII